MKIGTMVIYVENAVVEGSWFRQLGLEVDQKSEDYVVVQLGSGVELEMHSASSEQEAEFVDEAHTTPRFSGLYVYMRSADIDADFVKLQAISSHKEVVKRSWGNREFMVKSPSGLKIMVYELGS